MTLRPCGYDALSALLIASVRLLPISRFQGIGPGCSLLSFYILSYRLLPGGIPRAVKRAGAGGAPSTPGRLGYFTTEHLMDCAIALDAASIPRIAYFNTQ
jgi:hypothetical protein